MLRLYNTLTRQTEEFKPLNPPHVGIYTCGPTVYRDVHIGNFRTYLMSDFLRRTLEYNGYKVTLIKNITDVGHMRRTGHGHHAVAVDPIIKEALDRGKTPFQITERYTNLFLEDERKLNIIKADVYPKATKHIKEMIEMISILLKKGMAYKSDGNIYFNVKKFKNYGKLSGNTLDKMDNLLKAVRVSVETDKKDSVDFALWKQAEKDRLMKWDSPWARPPATSSRQSDTKQGDVAGEVGRGSGFPGWHIECSAMSRKYLGDTFDIHTGGEDLIFPHHEDEIAQSEGASGGKFVNYWLHGGYLLVDNQKMSRSKGNIYTISDLEKRGFDAFSFRYLTMMTHYRAKMNFTFDALQGAQTALNRLRGEVTSWDKPKIARPPATLPMQSQDNQADVAGEVGRGCAEYEQRFLDSLNNDLNMPEALAIIWELVRSSYPTSAKTESLFKFDEVLGLNLRKLSKLPEVSSVPERVMNLVKRREKLRKQEKFHLADQLRNEIKKMGYEMQDKKGGTLVKRT